MKRALNGTEVQDMSSGFSYHEMTLAMKSLKKSSSPGPDGVPASIINLMWNIIKTPVTDTINHHLANEQLPDEYLTARLKLLPKKGDNRNLKNWRPITVLNSKYKLLSAAYTNRLKRVVDKLVGTSQKGFSSIRRAHEVLLNLSEEISLRAMDTASSCAISFDFAAAFDTIDHNYIYEVMKFYKFPSFMISALKTMIGKRNARIITDEGELSIPFAIRRGVPQGDLHSPLTFIIATSLLLENLLHVGQSGSGIGKFKRTVEAFADDIGVLSSYPICWGKKLEYCL